MRTHAGARLAGLLAAALLALACQSNDPQPSTPTATVDPTATRAASEATASPEPDGRLRVAVLLSGQDEREQVQAALAPASDVVLVDDPSDADIDVEISDEQLLGGSSYVIETWVAVTDQRRDVLELSADDVRRIFLFEISDWAELGGTPQPIERFEPAEHAEAMVRAFRRGAAGAERLPVAEIPDLVAATPGAFALLPLEALQPGILALVVDGYDPYRDPPGESPLRLERWVRATNLVDEDRVAALVGFATSDLAADAPDPVGVLATGELIPARCTDAVLESIGDFGAMFDGTRDLLRGADLTVMPLEVTLTDLSPPTPCISTFVLQGRAEVVDAVAAAGIDVMITAGNHAMDCWSGCPRGEALLDTLARLDAAGIAHAGAGADIAAARSPAIVEVDGLRFAVLGYDSIAAYYAAGENSPGTAPLDLATLAGDVAAAAAQADHVIVGFGWGIEYTADPTAQQRRAAGVAVAAGASIVVGNHPHWVQAVEVIDGAVVVYALGNFVFDQSWSVPTTQGMVLEVGFTRDRLLGFRLRPIVIRGDPAARRGLYRPDLVDPAREGAPIMRRVWDASDRLPARDGESR